MLWMNPRFPFDHIERTLNEMNRVFDILEGPIGLRSMPRGTFPAVNVYETDDEYLLRADLPGVDPKDMDLSVAENTVTLTGKREDEQEDVRYYRRERPVGSFTRTVTLAERIDADKVKAEYKNGVLSVIVPKTQAAKPKSIAIKAK
ncbi:MAG TPA: Hsp20/alpha crystallin family protein [Anaerohalosphaeraceae bacterium]|jgi:HSP20 family protein|nr:Hsp20/alpha crystallin family protein [Anaerohalosphaeraceae bacterium]HRT50924.1 Hsp20/alpha crystallin family protein [Anaerohalosphaeraceae bacterium]HRT86615.1 Hsp20/alpha crystallin family protein [Anaerohalosphaeraceae bacterium]